MNTTRIGSIILSALIAVGFSQLALDARTIDSVPQVPRPGLHQPRLDEPAPVYVGVPVT